MNYKSLRNGKEGTKEWWLAGWDKVFDAQVCPMPSDLWERIVKVFDLIENQPESES